MTANPDAVEDMKRKAQTFFGEQFADIETDDPYSGEQMIEFAAAYALQIRNQTVEECRKLARHSETCTAFMERSGTSCDCGVNEEFDALKLKEKE